MYHSAITVHDQGAEERHLRYCAVDNQSLVLKSKHVICQTYNYSSYERKGLEFCLGKLRISLYVPVH